MISIIVPIYNAGAYLRTCIESLINQTVQDLQIILVDDGSTDDSLFIARSFAAQDKRIELIPLAHFGQSHARNNGIKHIKGEFVVFVDADDSLEPDWCERHLKAIDGVDYVQSGYRRVDRKAVQNVIIETKYPRFRCRFTSPCLRLYRREAIEGLSFEVSYIYEDVLYSIDLWLRGAKCRMINYTGYLYTLNPKSTTSRPRPEDQKRLFNALKHKSRNASLSGKLIILYTVLRLKIHFMQS